MRLSATRRHFFAWTQGLLALCASGGRTGGELKVDYYDKLGVTKIINAAGTYTALTASIMPPSVQAAVAEAAKHPVRLAELQKAAGEYLAKRLQCEAALVTAGAASGLTLATAACITRGQADAIERIPVDLRGLKNEVIVQKAHRNDYDHALLNCGIRFVEVKTLADYQKAFNAQTAMAHFFNAAEAGSISREDWVRVAHSHQVPCLNDAAADVPPISNLWNYTKMGFDLVTFSGGKGMRGPQNAGLLLGRKDLIEAAKANAMPISATIGRGMKVAKEEIVGMVAAVDWFLSQTDEGMAAEFTARANRIGDYLKSVPGLQSRIAIPPVANRIPHLVLTYDQARVKITPTAVANELRHGSPCIELNPATGQRNSHGVTGDEDAIVVGVWMLRPGEEMIVAQKLHEVLTNAI
jgi:L-seryl-tRNA(Ser) seleniumtransferase